MAEKAWVTLATNDTYALGALVLAHSLKKVNTVYKLVVLVSSNVTIAMRGTLQSIFDEVKEVNILDSGDAENLRLLARPELGITFTKLHAWRLTQYQKCVFLDADTLVLQNCDELFEREELSAAPDVGWPDCFNSGVFVFKPSEETFKALYEFAIAHGSFDGGDQGLLNMFFSDWATSDASKRLPFLYNLSSAAIYSYLPAFKWYGKGVKIVHFIGNSKPWSQPFNSATRTVEAAPGSSHLQNFLQYWWDLFCACVYQQLSPEMTRLLLRSWYTSQITIKNNPSRNNPMHNEVYIPEPFVAPEVEEHFIFTDPWEEFEKNIMASVDVEPSNNDYITGRSYNNVQNYNDENVHHYNSYDEQKSYNDYQPPVHNTYEPPVYHKPPEPAPVHYENPIQYAPPVHTQSNVSSCVNNNCIRNEYEQNYQQNFKTEQINVNNETCINDDVIHSSIQNDHSCDKPVYTNYSSLHSLKNEILREENSNSENKNEINDDAGLANSLSQITLEEPTTEQKAREDYHRRQNWEHGNIDYMGQDSFSNIWQKISETMSFEETKPEEAVPSTTSSPAPVAPLSSVSVAESQVKVESPVPEVCPLKPSASAEPLEPIVCPKPSKPSATDTAPAKPVAESTAPVAEPIAPKAPATVPVVPKAVAAEPVVPKAVAAEPVAPKAPVAEPAAPKVPVAEPVAPKVPVAVPVVPKAPAVEPVAPKAPVVEPPPPKAPVVELAPAPASQVPPKPETPVALPQASPVCQKPTATKEPAVASPKEEPQTAKSSQEAKSVPEEDPTSKSAAKPSPSKKK